MRDFKHLRSAKKMNKDVTERYLQGRNNRT